MKLKTTKTKVLVALSGGVDSSVAALLLAKQGYEVIGAFIKNWSEQVGKHQLCWLDDRRDAMRVAGKLSIPFVTFDFERDFRKQVIDYLYAEYQALRTPNPDIVCNKYIKFPLLLREAKKLGANYIATGHYCRLRQKLETRNSKLEINLEFKIQNSQRDVIYELYKAKDSTKDQSYFLYTLDQKILKHCLFPLGELTKKEVRRIAEENNLSTAVKPDSQGICFVGEMNMRDFLSKRLAAKPGKIITTLGEVIGEHRGLFNYTIGQRHGIGIGGRVGLVSEPLYVIAKESKKNQLVVGEKTAKELFSRNCNLEQVHWIVPTDRPKAVGRGWQKRLSVKARYRADDAPGRLTLQNRHYSFYFDKPERALTSGQSAVFYDGDKMLGGGIIK